MKKIYSHFLFIGILFLSLSSATFAAEIHFSADTTTGTTDDVFEVSLSIDGQVDGGQVGIEGLENFDIVGQRSSSQVQVVNGSVTSVQEKILSLAPKKEGDFTITALAKENGEEIRSTPISFSISKSLVQQTKENLLKNSEDTSEDTSPEGSSPPSQSNVTVQNAEEKGSQLAKNLLTTPSHSTSSSEPDGTTFQPLSNSDIKTFPKIEHIPAFNAVFWAQFGGILFLIFGGFFVALGFLTRLKKRSEK